MHNDAKATENEENKNNENAQVTKRNEGAEGVTKAAAEELEAGMETRGVDNASLPPPSSPLSLQIRKPYPGTPYPGTAYPGTPYPANPYPGTPYPVYHLATPYRTSFLPYPQSTQHPFAHTQPHLVPTSTSTPSLPFSNSTVPHSRPLPRAYASFIAPEVTAQNQKEIEDHFSPRVPAATSTLISAPASTVHTPTSATATSFKTSVPTPTPVQSPASTTSAAVSTTPVPKLTPAPALAPIPTSISPAPLFDLPPLTGPRLPSAQSLQPMGVPFGNFAWSGAS